MPARRTTTALAAATAASAAIGAALLAAPAAYADAPGDNGTVKIHDSVTDEADTRNEPHVCTFYLDTFTFDAAQDAQWRIVAWAPTGDKQTEVAGGTITLDAEGHGRTEDMGLADGHYKLYWNFDGEKGAAKHKVFWVECGTPSESPSPTPTDTASPYANSVGADGSTDTATAAATGGGALLAAAGGYWLLRRRGAAAGARH
ncbi:hypothetical protein ACFQLX_20170 [Streptomyces polyrhachis]|uniref:LPXTG cell wall anchor domain-containing protein n=1 Tax=Streptomyces polyrhachis TaxID=1282885 RepID=A0ABW2GIM9_9ACTN